MTKEELSELIKQKGMYLRSCWNCNPAHEHLKKSSYIVGCFICNKYYYKGKEIKILRGEDNE